MEDLADNGVGSGGEAVYVDELVFEAGGAIDLDGLRLYYRNGGAPKALAYGDIGLDGAIDVYDLVVFANHYGDSGADWRDGDFNGNGRVDVADLMILADNYGPNMFVFDDLLDVGSFAPDLSEAAPVPEPAGLILLALGAGVLPQRRRR